VSVGKKEAAMPAGAAASATENVSPARDDTSSSPAPDPAGATSTAALEAGLDVAGEDVAGEPGDGMAERTRQKDRILEAAFIHAAFDGWTRRTLTHAARDVGLDQAIGLRLFPRGGDSLVAWIDDWADRRMVEACPPETLSRLGVRGKIATLIRARLDALAPNKEAVRRAMLARALPHNALGTLAGVRRTLDRIWDAAGFADESGPSHYTRRLSLGAVLTTTALFWLEDKSEGHRETDAFLERRLNDALKLGRLGAPLRNLGERLSALRRRARPAG
jgi:ubiquinone biosynthesis protein COQ9